MNKITNEQRAHDLALAALPLTLKDPKLRESLTNEDGETKFDIYNIYLNIYNLSLESFNRDFPLD